MNFIYYTNKYNIKIEICKKQVKHLNLRVISDVNIKCSAPLNIPNDDIICFIENKSDWIYNIVEKIKKTKPIFYSDNLKEGGAVRIFGRYYRVKIMQNKDTFFCIEDSNLVIKTNILHDYDRLLKKYKQFIKHYAYAYYYRVLDELYPIVAKYGVQKPIIKIRKMHSVWGTCNIRNNCITLNNTLYKAIPACIEYIILHELIHFIYPHHNKDFYNLMSVCMPDWKERKVYLNLHFNEI